MNTLNEKLQVNQLNIEFVDRIVDVAEKHKLSLNSIYLLFTIYLDNPTNIYKLIGTGTLSNKELKVLFDRGYTENYVKGKELPDILVLSNKAIELCQVFFGVQDKSWIEYEQYAEEFRNEYPLYFNNNGVKFTLKRINNGQLFSKNYYKAVLKDSKRLNLSFDMLHSKIIKSLKANKKDINLNIEKFVEGALWNDFIKEEVKINNSKIG